MNYTKYEIARIIGARALQLAMGAPFLLNLTKEDLEKIKYNPIEIAKQEFDKGLVLITVKRIYPKPDDESLNPIVNIVSEIQPVINKEQLKDTMNKTEDSAIPIRPEKKNE